MGQPRPRGAGLEWGRRTLRHVFTHLRSLSSAASQVSGHGRRWEQRLPVREGRGGGEPPPDPFPSPFPPLRQWFPREREGRAKTGARTRIRSFTAVLARIPPRVLREAGQGGRRLPGCQRWGGLFLLPQYPERARPLLLWAPFPVPAPPDRPRRQPQFKTRLK